MSDRPTQFPKADDLELASAGFDTATINLLNTATSSHLGESELLELEQTLRDHGHALLRSADALTSRRLRAKASQLRLVDSIG